jgi:hypothetical protein
LLSSDPAWKPLVGGEPRRASAKLSEAATRLDAGILEVKVGRRVVGPIPCQTTLDVAAAEIGGGPVRPQIVIIIVIRVVIVSFK